MTEDSLSRDTLNARLSTLHHDRDPKSPPHFAWYAYYRIVAPEKITTPRRDTLTVECMRHQCTFDSKWRYLAHQGQVRHTLCKECHYEFDKSEKNRKYRWKYKDLIADFINRPELGFVLALPHELAPEDFINHNAYVEAKCTHCHKSTSHSVNNIKTHLSRGDHLFCQHCERRRKGKTKRISWEKAQQRITRFDIDPNHYQGISKTSLLTCRQCGQRHEWIPQVAEHGQCVQCGTNGARPITLMPSLDDFDILIRATTTWQLATDPALVKQNQACFALRHDLPAEAKMHVQCQYHPDQRRAQRVSSLHAKLSKSSCRACSAEKKSKYTAAYFEGLFSDKGIDLRVDLRASGLATGQTLIHSNVAIHLRCLTHGPLTNTYTSYQLIRYVRDNRHANPCAYCEPNSGLPLTAARVRAFVESAERWRTHGALYELVSTDDEINTQITQIQKTHHTPYDNLSIRVNIKQTVNAALGLPLPTPTTISILYKAFKKGKRGFINQNNVSFLAKFVEYFGHLWQLDLRLEQEFDGLKSEHTTRSLSIDFYQPTLKWAIEIDGVQHKSLNQQILKKADRQQKLTKQQRRDALVDAYFKKDPETTLIRIPCYTITGPDQYQPYTFPQQFDAALDICQRIYVALYGADPREIDKEALMTQSWQHKSNSQRILERLNQRYKGELIAQRHSLVKRRPRITISCRQQHAFQVSLSKAYLLGPLEQENDEAHCWACQRQAQFNVAKDKLKQAGWVWNNEAELRAQFHGTIDQPLVSKGSKKTIMLQCTHQHNVNRVKTVSLDHVLTPPRDQKKAK
ncbi:hypothetical protein R3X26_09335 [Vibrio sp. TH_r3]|uniref:hypothetical protein n=1 Tax=Vibrio sp. TH_r3 TaxID=3082084 RepID=UPI002953957B|nr:hypothetical protein [Vibrio sp. TH_r3]MDV7104597.1 hypothetical protein [Vibrio sp. TH_r3]